MVPAPLRSNRPRCRAWAFDNLFDSETAAQGLNQLLGLIHNLIRVSRDDDGCELWREVTIGPGQSAQDDSVFPGSLSHRLTDRLQRWNRSPAQAVYPTLPDGIAPLRGTCCQRGDCSPGVRSVRGHFSWV